MTICAELMDNPDCMCCPMMDVCTVEPDVIIHVTKEMRDRSNCNGGFLDAFDDVRIE
jgi:hypothetical protein